MNIVVVLCLNKDHFEYFSVVSFGYEPLSWRVGSVLFSGIFEKGSFSTGKALNYFILANTMFLKKLIPNFG